MHITFIGEFTALLLSASQFACVAKLCMILSKALLQANPWGKYRVSLLHVHPLIYFSVIVPSGYCSQGCHGYPAGLYIRARSRRSSPASLPATFIASLVKICREDDVYHVPRPSTFHKTLRKSCPEKCTCVLIS